MTTDEKLAAILAAVQTDPGNRGLARDPHDNLFTATAGQFQAACRSIAEHPSPVVAIFTGFWIPNATPPAFETDGPQGAEILALCLNHLEIRVAEALEPEIAHLRGFPFDDIPPMSFTHVICCERPGPTADGTFRTMRGLDITSVHERVHQGYLEILERDRPVTIGIGDGGNEIGMGSITLETMAKNIPNAARVRCVVPCDFLIVAGVSNWGAAALGAGIAAIRGGVTHEFFQSDAVLGRLEWMVRKGPLVDGVVGKPQATVDGLSPRAYAEVIERVGLIQGEIL